MTNDEPINPDEVIEQTFIEPEKHQIEQIKMSFESFKYNDSPPGLETLAEDSDILKVIARSLHSLFMQPGYVQYNDANRRLLESAICTFIDQIKQTTRENTIKEQQSIKAAEQEELDRWKNKASELEKLLIKAEDMRKDAESERDEYKEECDNYKSMEEQTVTEIEGLKSQIEKLKSDNDQEVYTLKKEIDQYDEKCKNLQENLKLNDISSKRLQDQLEQANEEIASLSSELVFTKSKVTSKSEKLEAAKSKIEKMTLENSRLDFDNQQMSTDLNEIKQKLREAEQRLGLTNQEELTRLEDENQRLRDSITHLSEICSSQSEDLSSVQQLQAKSTVLLRQQLELIAQYDAELTIVTGEKNDLQAQSEGDAKLISALQEQVAKGQQDSPNGQIIEGSPEYDEIRKMLIPRFGDRNPVDIVKDLLDGQANEELKQQNERQMGLVENLLRFISRLVNTGELKPLLPQDSPEQKLADDDSFKDSLLIEIARCRQFAMQNKTSDIQLPSPEAIQTFVNDLTHSNRQLDKELYNILSWQTLAYETLRKLYEKSNIAFNSTITELEKVKDIVNYENGPKDKLPSIIVEKLFSFKAFTQKLANIVDDFYNPDDFDSVLKYLFTYVNHNATILQKVDTELRQMIGSTDKLENIPAEACDYIANLQEQVAQSKEMQGLEDQTMQTTEISTQFQSDLIQARKTINELQTSSSNKDGQIEALKQENEDLKRDNQDWEKKYSEAYNHQLELENKYSKTDQNYKDLQEDNDKLRNENKALHDLIKAKNEDYDERLTRLIEKEREQHRNDLQRADERLKKKEAKFQEELQLKSAKVSALKKKMREIIDQYEKAFKTQKETTATIREQNKALAAKLEKQTVPTVNPKEVDKLRSEVRSLEAEKLLLNTKLKQLENKIEEVQAIRDNYWMAQMAIHDAEMSSKAKGDQLAETEEHEFAANENYENLLEQLITLLEPYLPTQYEINEDTIFNAISELIERIEQNETATKQFSQIGGNSFVAVNREAEIQQAKTLIALQEWDRWGRDLYINVTDGEVPCQSCKDLRYALGEMILASIGHRKLVYRLESLRMQKQLLLKMTNNNQKNETPYPTFRMLLIVTLGSLRVLRKAGHFPASYFHQLPSTSTKPTNVSLF